MAANRIYIQVDFQSQSANAAIAGLNQNIKSIGAAAGQATGAASKGVSGFSLSVEQSSRAVSDLQQALAGLAVLQLGRLMAEAADQINRVRVSLETMTGSAQLAADTLTEIRRIAKTQPFSFAELAEMGQRLKGFGFEAARIPKDIEAIADAAAALGKGKIGIDSITLALGQMRTKGVAQGQELFRQLAEQGINASKYLAEALSKEMGQAVSELDIRKMAEKNQIAGKKAVDVILAGMRRDFGGVGKELTQQLVSAQFNKLLDDLRDLAAVIMRDVAPALSSLLKWIRGLVQDFKDLPPVIRNTALALGALASAASVLPSLLNFLAFLPQNLKAVAGAAKAAGEAFKVLQAAGAALAAGNILSFFQMMAPVAGVLSAIGSAVVLLGGALAGFMAGSWIREKIPENSALGRLLNIDTERQAQRTTKALEDQAVFLAYKLRESLARAGEVGYAGKPGVPYESLSGIDLQDELARMRTRAKAIGLERQADREKLLRESEDEAKHHMEIAQQAFERAQGHFEGGIAQIRSRFQGLIREVAKTPEAAALAFKALNLEIKHFTEEWNRATQEINRTTDQAAIQAGAAASQRAADRRLAAIEGVPQDTAEQMRALEQERVAIQIDAARDAFLARKAIAERAFKAENEKLNQIQDMSAAMAALKWTRLAALQRKLDQEILTAEKEYEDQIASYIIDSRRRVNDAIERDEQQRLDQQIHDIDRARDLEIARVEARPARTIEEQIAQQNEILAIHKRSAEEILRLNLITLDVQHARTVAMYEDLQRIGIINQAQLDKFKLSVDKEYDRRRTTLEKDSAAATEKLELDSRKRINDAIYEEQRRIYENLKDAAGRVFDALLQKSTSVWKAIANAFKTAMLTAIREIVTSRIAASLYTLFGYGTVQPGRGGQQPTFGGTPGGGSGGFWNVLRGVMFPSGAPQIPMTTAPYNPNAPRVSSQGSADRDMPGYEGQTPHATAMQMTGWASQLASAKSFLTSLGNIGMKSFAKGGIGGMAGGALLLGGATLGYMGLQRGGWSGLAMTTAGGAMIGAKFGGPIGAAIGAAVGFAAGLVRMTIKNADEKVRDKVRQVYGVDITEKNIRLQIVEIAKQRYGGNLDLAIRSPEVQEIVNLYGLATGKRPGGMPRPMYPATFAQSGAGGLQMQPVYSNGQLIPSPYSGVTTSQWATAGLYVQLNPQQANDLFEGRVVNVIENNPAAVGDASANAARSGSSRDQQRGALLEPLTVMR